jgi:hypothetical protein
LRINVYLTQKISEDMLWNIAVNDAGAEYDPLTLLRTRTMFGRPDWMTIYGQVRQAIESGQYIPGSTSQLKTKVGVRVTSSSPFDFPLTLTPRPTTVDPVPSPKLLRKRPFTTPVRPWSSLSPRSGYSCVFV